MRVKLVRDRLGDRIDTGKVRPINSPEGLQAFLVMKLHEETEEIAQEPGNPEEYADLLQVLQSLAHHCNVDWDEIESCRAEKAERLGTFRRGLVWVE